MAEANGGQDSKPEAMENSEPVMQNRLAENYDLLGEFLDRIVEIQPMNHEETNSMDMIKRRMRNFLDAGVSNEVKHHNVLDNNVPMKVDGAGKPDANDANQLEKEKSSGALKKYRGKYLGSHDNVFSRAPVSDQNNSNNHFNQRIVNPQPRDEPSNIKSNKDRNKSEALESVHRQVSVNRWRRTSDHTEDSSALSSPDSDSDLSTSGKDSRSKGRRVKDSRSKYSRKHHQRNQHADFPGQYAFQPSGRDSYADYRQPPKLERFSGEDGQDFERFLNRFELYCEQNVRGGEAFWLGILEDHLEGKMLENFKIISKQYDEYAIVVQQLVEWHNESAEMRQRKLMKRFKSMSPDNGESLYRFSMRLFNAFRAAKPNHKDPNKSKTLMKRFMKSLPKRARRALKAKVASHRLRGNKPDWAFYQKCIKVADLYEDSSDSSVSSGSGPETVEVNLGEQQGEYNGYREFRGRRMSANGSSQQGNRRVSTGGSAPQGTCHTCGGSGHHAAKCWWNLGLCAACGGDDHYIAHCQKRANSMQSNTPKWKQQGEYRTNNQENSARGRGSNGSFRGRSFRGRGGFNSNMRGFGRGGNRWNAPNNDNQGQQVTTGANRANIGSDSRGQHSRGGAMSRLQHNAPEFHPQGQASCPTSDPEGHSLNW